ncbi:MAG TPA: glycosyltransferase family 2 protein [Solirubrobacteraceae bacterium]|nr:glycosyltransferase family 2 protein [Solirubrobacteraceae bacterium]
MRHRRQSEPGSGGLVGAFAPHDRLVLAAIAGLWLASAVFFWRWWFAPAHQVTVAGLVVNSAVLGFDLVLVPLWFFFFLLRMRQPLTALDVPELRTAIVVTKAPSEPWPLVRATLEAMLEQEFPYPYDVWLADEKLTGEVIDWCALHGVHMSSREGVAEYHNATWPRRTKCKEGNLAFFYDNWGYRDYDVVAQLDADHVPAPDYLRRMVAPFADPRVGYVAAPSICDRNADASWSARGRLHAEAVLHGSTQAGANAGFAPSCIGSHYAVRTAALEEVGGLGPELAEDFSTTLILSSHGWQGVFAIDAEAHGNGPDCVADCVTQDFQWARSMMRVLLTVSPRYWSGLSLRAKFRLAGCQLWYPLHTLVMLVMVLLPAWALFEHAPLVGVNVGAFYLHFVPVGFVLLTAVLLLRRRGLLRPATAPVISWESFLFQLVRWPWALIGCASGLWASVTGRENGFKVTPKRADGERPLPVRVLAPYLVLSAISILPVLLVRDPGAARGYYFWALLNGLTYLLVSIAVVALHLSENRAHSSLRSIARFAGVRSAVIASVAAILVFAAAIHGRDGFTGLSWPGRPTPAAQRFVPAQPAVVPKGATVDVGVTTEPLAANGSQPWTARDLSTVNAFEQAVHKHASVVMWYADWQHSAPSLTQLRLVERRGSIPEITWEPWDSTKALGASQPLYSLRNIAGGKFDAYIRTWARSLAAYGGPVRLRLAQEMNGNWYPWGRGTNRNTPAEFVRAWRHVHDIFTVAGATNVQWVWSPVSGAPRQYFPGVKYVNRLGVTCLNGGTATFSYGWRTFASICGESIYQLHAFAPQLPIDVSEVASTESGGSKAAWITSMFAFLAHHPEVQSFVWFNLDKQADWPVQSSRAAERAFRDGVQAARYK